MEVDVHSFPSSAAADEFEISVGRCSFSDDAPTEVLVVTDAVMIFGAAMSTVQSLMLADLPSMWIVGIGHGASNFRQTLDRRLRHLTPTAVARRPGSGGARQFLTFITEELSPWLEDRYGFGTAGSAYFGHSFGGLFGAWLLLNEPATFRRYGLSSPSLWWDAGVLFRQEDARAARECDLAARVLVTVGGREHAAAERVPLARIPEEDRAAARAEAAMKRWDMVAGARLFVDALAKRDYPSLEIDCDVEAGETHVSAWTLGLSRSLRYLFDAWGAGGPAFPVRSSAGRVRE